VFKPSHVHAKLSKQLGEKKKRATSHEPKKTERMLGCSFRILSFAEKEKKKLTCIA